MIFKMSNGYYIHVFNKKNWISEICIKRGHISDAVCVNRIYGAQSFSTSFKADLRHDLDGGFAFSRCFNGTFP